MSVQSIVSDIESNASKKVIVGMSGGVDSSVSAYLLQQQAYQVEGLFMKNWEEDDNDEYCAAAEDLKDAQAVAARDEHDAHRAVPPLQPLQGAVPAERHPRLDQQGELSRRRLVARL